MNSLMTQIEDMQRLAGRQQDLVAQLRVVLEIPTDVVELMQELASEQELGNLARLADLVDDLEHCAMHQMTIAAYMLFKAEEENETQVPGGPGANTEPQNPEPEAPTSFSVE